MFKINDKYIKKRKYDESRKLRTIIIASFLLGFILSSGINSCINDYNKNIYENTFENEVYLKAEKF